MATILVGGMGACGDDARTVRGTRMIHYVNESAETSVPFDLSGYEFAALIPDDQGGYREYPGEGFADGTFIIDGVPDEPYFLKWRSDALSGTRPSPHVIRWETSFEPDLSYHWQGRADAVYPTGDTFMSLSMDGLSPWQEGDTMEIVAPNVGAFLYAGVAPDPGATAISQQQVSFSGSFIARNPLIEGSKGDVAYFVQLVERPATVGTYQAMERVAVPPTFDLTDGGTSLIAGTFEGIDRVESVGVQLTRADFEGRRAAVHPSARVEGSNLYLGALHRWRELGDYGPWPDLLRYRIEPGGGDINDTLSYGDPFPTSWDRFAYFATWFAVDYDAPSTGESCPICFLEGGLGRRMTLDKLADGPIEPKVTQVRAPTIGGADAFQSIEGVGLTPVIAWLPPEIGTPTAYSVTFFEIVEPFGLDDIAIFRTAGTELEVPPDLLKPGAWYMLRIEATAGDNDDRGWSSVITSLFSP